MSILNSLSSSLGKRGNETEVALAKEIAADENRSAIKELAANLKNKNKKIQSDCLKVLYEIGYLKPELIAEYYDDFLELLTSKNNRLVWGAMIALMTITDLKHEEIFNSLNLLSKTIENGSVITIDCGVGILAKLNIHKKYSSQAEPLLIEQLKICPIKQLPQYMEKSLICITQNNKETFRAIIDSRIAECGKDSQKKRLQQVLKQIENI